MFPYYSIAILNIKSAYLPGGNIPREVYMSPSKGWVPLPFIVLRFLKCTHDLSELGRVWQLVVEAWLSSINLWKVCGLPYFFTNNAKADKDFVAIGKVVDDLLIIGGKKNVESFIDSISRRFNVGSCHIDEAVVLNGARISWQVTEA